MGACMSNPGDDEIRFFHMATNDARKDELAAALEARHVRVSATRAWGRGDFSLLMEAAAAGATGCVRVLLDRGASPTRDSGTGWTALHKAASTSTGVRQSSFDTMKLLVDSLRDRKEDVAAQLGRRTLDGDTPLTLALRSGRLDIAKLLLARGARWEDADPGVRAQLETHPKLSEGLWSVMSAHGAEGALEKNERMPRVLVSLVTRFLVPSRQAAW